MTNLNVPANVNVPGWTMIGLCALIVFLGSAALALRADLDSMIETKNAFRSEVAAVAIVEAAAAAALEVKLDNITAERDAQVAVTTGMKKVVEAHAKVKTELLKQLDAKLSKEINEKRTRDAKIMHESNVLVHNTYLVDFKAKYDQKLGDEQYRYDKVELLVQHIAAGDLTLKQAWEVRSVRGTWHRPNTIEKLDAAKKAKKVGPADVPSGS